MLRSRSPNSTGESDRYGQHGREAKKARELGVDETINHEKQDILDEEREQFGKVVLKP